MPYKHLLVEDDCLRAMRAIPAESVNLILCDLPYGTTQNAWDSVIPLDRLWAEYRRVLAPRSTVVLTSQGVFTARLILSCESWFKYKLVWEKSKPTNFLNAKKQPLRKHEDVCIFYPSQPHYTPQMAPGEAYDKGVRKNQLTGSYGDFAPVRVKSEGGRYPTDIVYFKTAESEGPVWHPTQKPVDLARYLVKTYSRSGDVVLDNAFGSGSFLVGAALEGRRAIGIELNQDMRAFKKEPADLVAVAATRLAAAAPAMTQVLRAHQAAEAPAAIRAFLAATEPAAAKGSLENKQHCLLTCRDILWRCLTSKAEFVNGTWRSRRTSTSARGGSSSPRR